MDSLWLGVGIYKTNQQDKMTDTMESGVMASSFRMAEREGALIQYLLRYIRGLDEPNCEKYTLIIMVQALSNSTFQIMTLNRYKTSTILELKQHIAHEFAIRSPAANGLVIKYEQSGETLADEATLCSLNLHDVTVLNVSAAVTRGNLLQPPPCKT